MADVKMVLDVLGRLKAEGAQEIQIGIIEECAGFSQKGKFMRSYGEVRQY